MLLKWVREKCGHALSQHNFTLWTKWAIFESNIIHSRKQWDWGACRARCQPNIGARLMLPHSQVAAEETQKCTLLNIDHVTALRKTNCDVSSFMSTWRWSQHLWVQGFLGYYIYFLQSSWKGRWLVVMKRRGWEGNSLYIPNLRFVNSKGKKSGPWFSATMWSRTQKTICELSGSSQALICTPVLGAFSYWGWSHGWRQLRYKCL